MKPTILYIITQDSWGGAQRYVFDLSTHLCSKYRVVIGIGGLFSPQGLQERIQAFNKAHGSNIEVITIPSLIRTVSLIQDIKAVAQIRTLYKKLKPSIVHLNSSKAGVLGSLARMHTHIPVVYTVHGWVFKEPTSRLRSLFYLYSEKLTKYFKDRYIVLSEEEKTDGQKLLHIPETALEIIPLGIEKKDTYHTRADAQKILDIEENTDVVHIGAIANFFATKGLTTLVEALHILSKDETEKKYHVHLIGDGPTRNLLESKIMQYHLQTIVTMHGFIPEAEKLIQAFDLFIIPSLKEGLPYALLESVKMGIPVIATHVGGIPSFANITQADIQLMPPNNPEAQASAIKKALQARGASSRTLDSFSLPPIFSLSYMTEKTDQLYTTLIKES